MRSNHLLAAVVVSLSCALLSASCARSPDVAPDDADTGGGAPAAETEPTGEVQQPAYEDVFHFVEVIKDDGEGKAGGWQRATATLKFCEWRLTPLPVCWKCPTKVEMPIRTEKHGRISPRIAAKITAEVATDVTDSLMHSRNSWVGLQEAYCQELHRDMRRRLNSPPYEVGARVGRP